MEALADTRVVFLTGARQVGKSTLTRVIAADDHAATMVSFDDDVPREAARSDPTGFLEGLPGPVVIDEVQRVPELLLAIKDRVDRDTRPGRFLLTGSANVFASRRVREALTGRMETIVLWPLAQTETQGSDANIVDLLFAGRAPDVQGAPIGRAAFASVIAAGGYPEALLRPAGRRRDRWFANYIQNGWGSLSKTPGPFYALRGRVRGLSGKTCFLLSLR